MLATAQHFPDYNFIVAKAPGIADDYYDSFLEPYKNVTTVSDKTYSILMQSKAALVTSGTATLETALFGIPQIVCYKGSNVSYQIAKRLVKVKYISLVNLIMDRPVVKELIQNDLTVENLRKELHVLIHDFAVLQTMKRDYQALWDLLSQGGRASTKAARSIVDFLKR